MSDRPAWQWNEIQQVGTDYTDLSEVERYERRMGEFRNLAAEDAALLADLALPVGANVLEIGTGTGHFARAAAKAGLYATAIDISPAMLRYARSRADADNLSERTAFEQAGFLTFAFEPERFDAAVSVAVLHHLPDLWKAVALRNVYRTLKPGGRFVLRDVVFAWEGDGHAAAFDAFVADCQATMHKESSRHIAQEFSTLDWIMAGLLQRAGFELLRTNRGVASIVQYLCVKR